MKNIYDVLMGPRLTEKANQLQELNEKLFSEFGLKLIKSRSRTQLKKCSKSK